MRTMTGAWATYMPWPLGGPDADPSHHYTYLLFVPPALALGFVLVHSVVSRLPAYAALPTRRRLPTFLGAGAVAGILLCVALAAMQSSVDHYRRDHPKAGTATSMGAPTQDATTDTPVSEAPNPFASAFCAGALERAKAAPASALKDERAMRSAVDCLVVQPTPTMVRTLVPERVALLADRLYPPDGSEPPNVPASVERGFLYTLLAYRDWSTLARVHERHVPLTEKFETTPVSNDPLWWIASNYDGRPLGLDDMQALEALGVDLRQRNMSGQQFLAGYNRAHDLHNDALAHLVRLGMDRASPIPPSLAVEVMYRRFGWQRGTGSAADLAALLTAYPSPTPQELAAAASVSVLDPRTLGLASVDPEKRKAYLAYLGEHGLAPGAQR